MPTAITPAELVIGGVSVAGAAAAAGGNYFANDGKVMLIVENTHATDPRTITFDIPALVDGLAVTDKSVTLAALSIKAYGPFPKSTYNDVDGNVQVTYSDSAANLKVKAVAY